MCVCVCVCVCVLLVTTNSARTHAHHNKTTNNWLCLALSDNFVLSCAQHSIHQSNNIHLIRNSSTEQTHRKTTLLCVVRARASYKTNIFLSSFRLLFSLKRGSNNVDNVATSITQPPNRTERKNHFVSSDNDTTTRQQRKLIYIFKICRATALTQATVQPRQRYIVQAFSV